MVDPEVVRQPMLEIAEEEVARVPAGHDEVRGQRGLGGAHRPDVEIVDPGHARQRGERPFDGIGVDPLRHRVERHRDRFLEQPPGAPQDHRDHQQAHRRIDPGDPGEVDQGACGHHCGGDAGIGGHVEIGAADVDVVLAPAREQQRRGEVDQDAHRRDDHHRHAGNGMRIGEPLRRFERDRAHRDEQQQRVGERRQDRGAAQAIGEALAGRTLGELGPAPGDQQAEHVGKIVPRIGEQGDRSRPHPGTPLHRDKGKVEQRADREGAAEVPGRVRVRVGMMMVVVMRGHSLRS